MACFLTRRGGLFAYSHLRAARALHLALPQGSPWPLPLAAGGSVDLEFQLATCLAMMDGRIRLFMLCGYTPSTTLRLGPAMLALLCSCVLHHASFFMKNHITVSPCLVHEKTIETIILL